MKYIVLRTTVELEDVGDIHGHETYADQPPLLCGTRGEAEAALEEWIVGWRPALDNHRDWSVWEVVDGRCLQRSVTFKDGKPEIQS
jgi:hypothetical protein